MTVAIRFENLTLGYDRHPAVHHLNATVARGSLTAVVGPNGAGKSTLLKAIAGVLRPLEGRVDTGATLRDGIAYLPQQAGIDRGFPIRVFDMAAMGVWRRVGAFGAIAPKVRAKVAAAIAAVGLTGLEERAIGALSGGQLQRALFARLLLQDAEIILLDEPFTAIDAQTSADLLQLIQRWRTEGRTVIAVLHDLEEVRRHFPDALLLAREPVAFGPTAEALTAANLARARQLCEIAVAPIDICRRPAPNAA